MLTDTRADFSKKSTNTSADKFQRVDRHARRVLKGVSVVFLKKTRQSTIPGLHVEPKAERRLAQAGYGADDSEAGKGSARKYT